MRSSPPQVVERADPAAVAEVMRLRDKVAARDDQARRAHRAAAEAQEAVGRESAINQVILNITIVIALGLIIVFSRSFYHKCSTICLEYLSILRV